MTTSGTLRVHRGDGLPMKWTNTGSAIGARALVVMLSGLVGVAQADIAASTAADPTGVLLTAGVYEIAKATHATTKAFVAGEAVYWDAANNRVDKAGTSGAVYLGQCYKSAGSTEAVMWVDLNARPKMNFSNITVSSGQAAANSGDGQADIATGLAVRPSWFDVKVVDASTGLMNVGYVVDPTTVPGTITVKGISSGLQLDAGDIILLSWVA